MDAPVTKKRYDLEDRCLAFAGDVRHFLSPLPASLRESEDADQVKRSSGSIGANYIEANEALGKGDFKMRIRIARKEAKESRYWLLLFQRQCPQEYQEEVVRLIQECRELELILGAILRKVTVS